MQSLLRIAITPGEPAGIGPELTLKLAQLPLPFEIVAIANMQMLEKCAQQSQLKLQLNAFDPNTKILPHMPGQLNVVDLPIPSSVTTGKLNVENSSYVIETLNTAIEFVQNNTCHALTTGPVQKSTINDAGISFSGHTEFIAKKTGGYPVMLLTNEAVNKDPNKKLRVALVTTHLAISEVATSITPEKIEQVLNVLHQDLIQKFGIANPCICVCGLNPHAGEGGHLGNEEIEFISPLLKNLRKNGMNLVGPLPADTAFTEKNLIGKDVVLAMYHDQGLPVIKHGGFGDIVNVTLGLPIIRTSVDHGTALDIAGQGIADVSSLHTAVSLAAKLASSRF